MRPCRSGGLTGAALLALSLPLLAAPRAGCDDAPPFVPDRPGFGESASAVAPGRVQLEAGATWQHLGADSSSFDTPQLLARIGLHGAVELRVGVPDWTRLVSFGAPERGWSDSSLGLKAHWAKGASDFALRGTLYLPTGSAGFSSDRTDPELALSWSRTLGGPWSLGATLNERWTRASDQAFTTPAVALGRSLGEHAATFFEYAPVLANGSAPVHQIDHGYTWNAGPTTQLDVSFGYGFTSPTTWFAGAGIVHRF